MLLRGCWLSSGLQLQWSTCASQVALVAKGEKERKSVAKFPTMQSQGLQPSVHRILQSRILEWVAIFSSRSSNPGNQTWVPASPVLQADFFFFFITKSPICLPMQVDVRDTSLTPGLGRSCILQDWETYPILIHSSIFAWRISWTEEPCHRPQGC